MIRVQIGHKMEDTTHSVLLTLLMYITLVMHAHNFVELFRNT